MAFVKAVLVDLKEKGKSCGVDGGLGSKCTSHLDSPCKVFGNEEGLSLQGKEEGGERKVCLEKGNRHVYGHVTGLGANETTREGATRWAPSGAVERMISNTGEEGGQPWMQRETGGGGREGER